LGSPPTITVLYCTVFAGLEEEEEEEEKKEPEEDKPEGGAAAAAGAAGEVVAEGHFQKLENSCSDCPMSLLFAPQTGDVLCNIQSLTASARY
jgi:hypothetical protein